MKRNPKISAAVAAILSAPATTIVIAAPAETSTTAGTGIELQEVVVTATRRAENLQNVPIAIQALTGDTLSQLNATTFDDYVKYLPNVTAQGLGPGQNNIYMRGLATGVTGIQGSGVVGSFPNVAIYLDEQSAQVPGRNLDIFAADLERIEVLEGPQGTLFGAGAEAGVFRYITNKPKINVTEAHVNAAYETTAHGTDSTNIDATINLPLIADKMAFRAVIYNESRGGYINNVPATFARADTDLGIHYAYAGGKVPANSVVINNNSITANAINSVTYQGIRAGLLYQFNDDWNALLTQMYQQINADGVFAEMAANSLGQPQPDLTAQLYNPSFDKDHFENTALTVNGRVGALRLVYAGAYLDRNVTQIQDYTNYARAKYVDYYQCANPGKTPATAVCFTPSSTWHDIERNTHLSQELRLSTPDDWRLRGVGGLFYENYQIQEQVDWLYGSATPYFYPIGPPTGYYTVNGSVFLPNGYPVKHSTPGAVFVPGAVDSNNPNIRPPGDSFFDDIKRGYKQKAAYLSLDLDLIPKRLTITAGTRYSKTESTEVGSAIGSFGCKIFTGSPPPPNPCINHNNGANLSSLGLDTTVSGWHSRANLSFKITDDALVYYTWSQGFRVGGFNRPNSVEGASPLAPGLAPYQKQALAHGGWVPPVDYGDDTLTNNEVGWKTMWLDKSLQWNGAVYQEDWKNVQIAIFDPGVTGNLTFSTNGGNYRVRGVETSIAWRATRSLTLDAGAAWNHTELVKEAPFVWADGTPIDFTTLTDSKGNALSNPGGAVGSPLAASPPFMGNARARYDWTVNSYNPFVQVGVVHQAHSFATADKLTLDLQGNSIAYELPAFTTYDASIGVGKDAWVVTAYGENLSDERAQLYANYRQWYKAVTTNRPRTFGLRFTYNFSGS
jgi:outer membrane receptor protein involved in Fe transport